MLKLEVTITKKIFYKDGWGIFGCKPNNKEDLSKVEVHPTYGNFSVKGNVIELVEGDMYMIEIGEIERSPKGNSYPLLKLHMPDASTSKAQYMFIKTIMSENQYQTLCKMYPESKGYKVLEMIKSNELDLTKLKGIGVATAKRLIAKITTQSEKIQVINELMPLGVTDVMIDRIIDHFKDVPTVMKKIKESLYNLCEVDGLGFIKVDEYALAGGENEEGNKRIEACVNYLIQQFAQEGHSWTHYNDMVNAVVDLTGINHSIVENFLLMELESTNIINESGKITNTYIINTEKGIYNRLVDISSDYNKLVINDDELNKVLDRVQDETGIILGEEQRFVVLDSFNHGVYVINGSGGVGKSVVIKFITEICKHLKLTYKAMALSGRASQLLSLKDIDASTIHRALGTQGSSFLHDSDVPMEYDVIIVEETSMVNASLINSILKAVKQGAKVIFVGDSGQLSGIGYGDVLRDLLKSDKINGTELIQIHRQAEGSGIIQVAGKVREGKHIVQYAPNGNTSYQIANQFGEQKDFTMFTFVDKETFVQSTYAFINRQLAKLNKDNVVDFQILVSNKKRGQVCSYEINKHVQSKYVDNIKTKAVNNGTYDFYIGDKVIVNGNSYKINGYHSIDDAHRGECILNKLGEPEEFNLYNGSMGIIEDLDLHNNGIILKFEGMNCYLMISGKELRNVDLGYAITIHKSQGMTIKFTLTILDNSAYKLLSRQLLYTGITRASHKGFLFAEHNSLFTAVKNDASGIRRTFLGELLKQSEED